MPEKGVTVSLNPKNVALYKKIISDYEFNDLDYSFTLQITEVIDITDNFNLSSKRGIIDT